MNITKHAKERYAERIMDRNDKVSISVFISQHEDKIKQDIEKMIQYAEVIYEGESIKNEKDIVRIYLNGLWVIITDVKTNNVITLYSVDLGVDNELNNLFVSKLKKKIESFKEKYIFIEESLRGKQEEYRAVIKDNDAKINNYKKIIRSLEDQNHALKELMEAESGNLREAKTEIQEVVMTLIGKKAF